MGVGHICCRCEHHVRWDYEDDELAMTVPEFSCGLLRRTVPLNLLTCSHIKHRNKECYATPNEAAVLLTVAKMAQRVVDYAQRYPQEPISVPVLDNLKYHLQIEERHAH